MPVPLGAHNSRVALLRSLRTQKGRKETGLFSFEGDTLLREAMLAEDARFEMIVATQRAYERFDFLHGWEERGAGELFIVDDRTFASVSDVVTPSGVMAVSKMRFCEPAALAETAGLILVLADLNDPGNAGTLLRSAWAFDSKPACVFGDGGVGPYHPKVVRSAMGASFHARLARAGPEDVRRLARHAGYTVVGLTASGADLRRESWAGRTALVVGHERYGLGRWTGICDRFVSISMPGRAESLNAAAAGSIALYEASKPM